MSDNTFARLMGQIGEEADQQQAEEVRAAQRQAKWRSIRKVGLIILGVSTVGWAYANRAEIGHRLSRTASPPVIDLGEATPGEAASTGPISGEAPTTISKENVGSNLKFIQTQAHQRDQALLELNK